VTCQTLFVAGSLKEVSLSVVDAGIFPLVFSFPPCIRTHSTQVEFDLGMATSADTNRSN
jgi:hypothetical protein